VPNAAGLLAEQIMNSASDIGDVGRENRTTSND
jgi:hypothetical protein